MKQSNDLRYTIDTKDSEGNFLRIKIRLNDECKNGHQDFAITADAWEKGKPRTDAYYIYGGCCHDEILKVHPELKIFVDLHLCDYLGIPMHATANMQYHMKTGFTKNKDVRSPEFKSEFCEYYRIMPKQFELLQTAHSESHFALVLMQQTDILANWKKQAGQAIAMLESWTETKFLIDSTKTQLNVKPEDIETEKQKIANGYYSEAAVKQRNAEKIREVKDKIGAEIDKKIQGLNNERETLQNLIDFAGLKAFNNAIFYQHSQTLSLNWKSYEEQISAEECQNIRDNMWVPEGVKIELHRDSKHS